MSDATPLPASEALILRPARSRDAEAVGRVLTRSYGTLWTGAYPAPLLRQVLPLMTRANPRLLALPSYLVAVLEGRIVAVGGWSRARPDGGQGAGDVGHVRHVACDPEFLCHGFARALMEASFASARADGIRLLCCHSARPAVGFYRALGFEGGAEIELRVSPGVLFPAVEMRRDLSRPAR